ncbi:hypothetical protein WAI453_013100 [Rhynchosporium graminicola]
MTNILLPKARESQPNETLQAVADNIYLRLLLPFTDVLCFFALDLGGLQPIARRLAAWLDVGHPPTLPVIVPPQIIIITETYDCKDLRELKNFAIPLIASSLLLDGYHPDTHPFRPRDVFRLLYKDSCLQACRDSVHLQDPAILVLPSGSVRMIEDAFSELFMTLSSRPTNIAADLHHKFFLELHHDWKAFQLDNTCLICLRRTPRIGGIIAIRLSICGWTIEQATENLEHYAELAFQPRSLWNTEILLISQFLQVIDFMISYLADSRYSADNLEAALREAFGSNRSMLDYSNATRIGTCVGLPVTTIRDTSIYVFTNYNGVGTRSRNCGMVNAARCGSAAPFYFKPKHITGLGTFQDGGLRENNPGNLTLEETAVIYPSIDELSLMVSLGTGSSRPSDIPRMSPSRGIFQDGFIARLLRVFKLSFGSIRGHKFRSRRREGRKEQYFRFDMEFDGPEPALDNTTKMQELKTAARAAVHGSTELKRLARCIVAELFVFELDHDPSRENGKYLCTGRILCRRRANHHAFDILMKQLSKKSIKFFVEGRPIEGLIDSS